MGRQRNTDYQRSAIYIASKCGKDRRWKLYIIATEGDKTEPNYFNALITQYEQDFRLSYIHVEFIDREKEQAGNSDPKYVYETLLKFYEERPLFKEELNPREMVEHLYHIVQQNLTKEQFNNLSEVVYLF
ncbi:MULTISPECIES: RloB domain-containing protein [Aphanizomenon]|uniref:RloB domain-containing protein n=1 Tax=Aphanizomenon TaxID=1175 RepID=UPI00054391F4|nr:MULTISPECIES: RloB domain-containing protein [Aphanizomenon]KHG41930.1 hypothetical protein OA07_08360 [Aphanizomenon flos-aquae 2012/KM1/D3]MTJ29904.1 RloB domain-containing protein [Aphanizomenon sp. UHCC 0183]QSV73930.1 MAG: RloB domain-containing protein [Aphanizomenon flos-aquae KM1D3_PB]